LPAFIDHIGPTQAWRPNWLAFSHGRAALAFLLDRRPARSALLCAYTCPSVPSFLARRGIAVATFDVGASVLEVAAAAMELPPPRLILAPALFGTPPWFDTQALPSRLDPRDVVVLDAAQTAFGHVDFAPPPRGAVLSCPRKSTELADGAVLALAEPTDWADEVLALPVAREAAALKAAARALWATAVPELEQQAVALSRRSEDCWPDTAHRMTDTSRAMLQRIDRGWHRRTRVRNSRFPTAALAGRIPLWRFGRGTPFCLAAFVNDRDATLQSLQARRVFASALWPDAEHDPERHPAASWMVRHLIALPVDQRHEASDMHAIADALISACEPPERQAPDALAAMLE
jgi:hypothetical protein